MKRKIFSILLIAVLACTLAFSLVACNKDSHKYTIVYLGDSIAEALIGPSPLSERDNYGYYALIGKTNDFNYYNHSVSGHKTSGGIVSGNGLLEMVNRDTEDATLMKTHIQQADMIHISVLGNNLLQYNLGLLMLEVADPDFEDKYENDKNTLINALEDGSMEEPMYRTAVEPDKDGKFQQVEFKFPPTYSDIDGIVTRLKALNSKATIVFQKVYNPFFEGSKHLSSAVLEKLGEINDDGRFGDKGKPIQTIEQVRKLADYLLGQLNGILDKYLAAHPGAFKILDAQAEFQKITELDTDKDSGKVKLGGDSLGRKLIYQDWTHPSNFGHAVIAGMTQDLLNEMGVASSNAVANYKAIRIDQINRLFKSNSEFKADEAIAAINAAGSYLDVTLAYFKAIEDATPVVPTNPTSTNNSSTSFSSTQRFEVDFTKFDVMDFKDVISTMFPLVGDTENTYVEFDANGKMHFQLQTAEGLLSSSIGGMLAGLAPSLANFDIEGAIDSMVEPMFPGFKAKLRAGDLAGALKIIQDGLGFNIVGLDYEDEGVKEILTYVAEHMALPEFIFEKLPKDTVLTLTFDSQYYIKDVKGADGKTYKGIFVSHIGGNNSTQPYCVFTVGSDEEGNMTLEFTAEFMNATVAFKQSSAE